MKDIDYHKIEHMRIRLEFTVRHYQVMIRDTSSLSVQS